ncbi:MAG: 2'-5' RNA ligase family protein [Bacteroidia bacterium]
MKKRIYNQISLFGPLYAFLVVLSPPDEVRAAIARIKKELNALAGITDRNLHSIAHITLTDKLTDDSNFADTVAMLLSGQKSFCVKISGWGMFDHGHSVTVYLAIENPEPIVLLSGLLKSAAKTPHISLAKRIPHETYNRLLPYLQNLNYSAQWQCTEINVLRKLMSEKQLGFKESFKIPLQ